MSATELLAAYDAQVRMWVPPRIPAEHDYVQTAHLLRVAGQRRGFIDPAPDIPLRGAQLDRLIAEHRDFFAARGEAVEWKTRDHDRPPEITERLRAAGFVPDAPETVVIASTARVAAGVPLPGGVTARAVAGRRDLDRVAGFLSGIWGEDPPAIAADLEALVRADPGQVAIVVAEAGGQVIAAARIVFMAGTEFAGLWAGATLPARRGQGIYRALVALRAQMAAERGVRFLLVDASSESRPILLRLGFTVVATTTPYVWTPA